MVTIAPLLSIVDDSWCSLADQPEEAAHVIVAAPITVLLLLHASVSAVSFQTCFYGSVPWMDEVCDCIRRFCGTPVLNAVVQAVGVIASLLTHWPTPLLRFGTSLWSILESLDLRLAPWCLANRYANFGTVFKKRTDIVIQGRTSSDGEWRCISWKYNPAGDVKRRPPLVAFGHIPELDWRLALLQPDLQKGKPRPVWLERLMDGILSQTPEVCGLVGASAMEGHGELRVVVQETKFGYETSKKQDCNWIGNGSTWWKVRTLTTWGEHKSKVI